MLRMSDKEPYDPIPLSLAHFSSVGRPCSSGHGLPDYNLRLSFETLRWRIDPANVP